DLRDKSSFRRRLPHAWTNRKKIRDAIASPASGYRRNPRTGGNGSIPKAASGRDVKGPVCLRDAWPFPVSCRRRGDGACPTCSLVCRLRTCSLLKAKRDRYAHVDYHLRAQKALYP